KTPQDMGFILKTQVPNLEKLGIKVDLSQRSANSRIKVLKVGSFVPPEDLQKKWGSEANSFGIESSVDNTANDDGELPF
ncbi:MAG: hypothetical protein P8P30_11135, partial [Rickettsiales bacterium]|nr:hypothetical protein [Rickettsiales bacterium]